MFLLPLIIFGLAVSSLASTCWRTTNCTGPVSAAFPGEWESYMYAPTKRYISPQKVLSHPDGNWVSDYPVGLVLRGNGSVIVLDFGKEVGGIVHVNYSMIGDWTVLGLAFTESKNWIGIKSDDSTGSFPAGGDGALSYNITSAGAGSYSVPDDNLRGGFRYLTLFLTTGPYKDHNNTLTISNVSLELSFQPTWPNLRAYGGYFSSSDSTLNKIWYSGAWTLQSNAVPPNTGRHATNLKTEWQNNALLGLGDTIAVDGAKRDRWVWPGDMVPSTLSGFVSTGDMESIKNALQVLYNYQYSNGQFPCAGPPYQSCRSSDVYHIWTLVNTYNYVLFTNDTGFLDRNWAGYVEAMAYVLAKVNADGIFNTADTEDWGRYVYATNTSSWSMALYRALQTGAVLATLTSASDTNTNLTDVYLTRASALKAAILTHCWDESIGAFKDSPGSNNGLYPQDANAIAVALGVVEPNSTYATNISSRLTKYWTPIGPASPELPDNVSPFITGYEIEAHFLAGRPDRALDLIHTCWGWYLDNPNGTGSTVIEGYATDGSFNYRGARGYRNDPSYASHSHGWSSGPTWSLTSRLVGLVITAPLGARWGKAACS